MSENEMDGKDESVNGEAERVRFENERMTRRKALRKFGFTAGMAVFSVLTVDDLARVASKKLQETEATKGIGDMLVKEFRSAGVAMANPYGSDPYGGGGGTTNPYGKTCEQVVNDATSDCYDAANSNYTIGSSAHTAAVDACYDEQQRRLSAECGFGGGGGTGNPYRTQAECQDDCDQQQLADQQSCANIAPAGAGCIQNGYPAGNPSNDCQQYNGCMTQSGYAYRRCYRSCESL